MCCHDICEIWGGAEKTKLIRSVASVVRSPPPLTSRRSYVPYRIQAEILRKNQTTPYKDCFRLCFHTLEITYSQLHGNTYRSTQYTSSSASGPTSHLYITIGFATTPPTPMESEAGLRGRPAAEAPYKKIPKKDGWKILFIFQNVA
jgi:hypothetical protein